MADALFDEAARWALRHPLSVDDGVAFEAWLAGDPRRRGASLRALAALSMVDRAIAPASDPAAEPAPRAAGPNRRWLLAGFGGTAAAAAVSGLVGWQWKRGERVLTARGEIRRLPLADGSIAAIDTSSELRIALSRDARRIALARGQAWFQVAKDKRRPFVVDAGIAQVQAVGTAFSVRRTDEGVRIAVTEGRVAIWAKDASGAVSILEAGQFATFRGTDPVPETGRAPGAIERSLAWRDGEIALEGETLDEAVAAFNRYNRQQLAVADRSLGAARLIGLFQIDNPAGFARTLELTLDVTALVTPEEIRIARK